MTKSIQDLALEQLPEDEKDAVEQLVRIAGAIPSSNVSWSQALAIAAQVQNTLVMIDMTVMLDSQINGISITHHNPGGTH